MTCTAQHKKTDTQTSGLSWVIGGVLLLVACLYYNTGDARPRDDDHQMARPCNGPCRGYM